MDSLGEIRQRMAESFHRIQDLQLELGAIETGRQAAIEEAMETAMEILEDVDPATALEVKNGGQPMPDGSPIIGAMAFNTVEDYEAFMHELMESEFETMLEEAGCHYWWNGQMDGWIRMVLLP